MYDGHNIMEISGNRLAVRAEMRRVMLASEKPDSSSSSSIHAPEANKSVQRPPPPRIVVDVHKVLKLLMDALEQRRDGIKRDLTALFDAVRSLYQLKTYGVGKMVLTMFYGKIYRAT